MIVVSNILRTFKGLRFGLIIKIRDNIPNLKKDPDIRLGNIIISQLDNIYSGIV